MGHGIPGELALGHPLRARRVISLVDRVSRVK